jgi:hypothetical protein
VAVQLPPQHGVQLLPKTILTVNKGASVTFKIARIALAIVLAGLATDADAATKVFLLGGQSNMVGVGEVAQLASPYNVPQSAVKFWDNAGGGWVNLQGGFGASSAYFGPEVGFGSKIHALFPTDSIYLVKYAVGGTNLAVDWNPDGNGAVYNTFKGIVTTAMQSLTNPQIAGMIWMQGESDGNYVLGPAYATNLTNFIGQVRSDFATPDTRFVLGRISSYWDTPPYSGAELVRAAQVTVPGQVGNAAWVDTDDLQMSSANPGHYGTQGQIDLGILFANEFIQTPEPSTLVLVGTGLVALMAYWWRKRKHP